MSFNSVEISRNKIICITSILPEGQLDTFLGREVETLTEIEEHLKEVCGGEPLRPFKV
jgi:hypothetical protein